MTEAPLKTVSMPKRFTVMAALLLGAIAVGQAGCAIYGVDMQVAGMHIPVAMSWIIAVLFGGTSVLAFREAHA